MPRNDSILNTGMHSGSIGRADRARELREERDRRKEETRSIISPTIEPVLEELRKERERTTLELLSLIDANTPEADVKASIVALKAYKTSVENLSSRLSNIMREKPKKEVTND